MATGSLSRKQKALASAVGIVPVTIAGIALLRCGCASAAFAIEIGGPAYRRRFLNGY
jgi:hypothetical protein